MSERAAQHRWVVMQTTVNAVGADGSRPIGTSLAVDPTHRCQGSPPGIRITSATLSANSGQLVVAKSTTAARTESRKYCEKMQGEPEAKAERQQVESPPQAARVEWSPPNSLREAASQTLQRLLHPEKAGCSEKALRSEKAPNAKRPSFFLLYWMMTPAESPYVRLALEFSVCCEP